MIPANFSIMPAINHSGVKNISKITTYSMNFFMAIQARDWVPLTKPGGLHYSLIYYWRWMRNEIDIRQTRKRYDWVV